MGLFQKLKDWNEENLRMEQEQGTAQKAQREASAVKHIQEKQIQLEAQLEAAAAKIKELEEQAAIQSASLAPVKIEEPQKTPLPDDKVSRGQQQATQSQPQTYKSEQEQRYVSIIGPHLKQTTPLPDDDQSRAIKKQPQTYKSLLEKKQEQAALKKAPLLTAQTEWEELHQAQTRSIRRGAIKGFLGFVAVLTIGFVLSSTLSLSPEGEEAFFGFIIIPEAAVAYMICFMTSQSHATQPKGKNIFAIAICLVIMAPIIVLIGYGLYSEFGYFGCFCVAVLLILGGILNSSTNKPIEGRDGKKCPFCAEIIKHEAKVCKHCGNPV